MNNQEWYQDTPKSHAAIVYGEVSEDQAPRHVQAYFGQEAYETLQLHIYTRELLRVEDEPGYLCWSQGFGLLWAALEVLGADRPAVAAGSGTGTSPLILEEIGSTLFSTINKLIKLRVRHSGVVDPRGLRYVGVEPSRIFARTAELLHQGIDVRHHAHWRELSASELPALSRSYQATSYAFRDVRAFGNWVFRATTSLHGVWFSVTDHDETIQAHGKRVTLFSLEQFCADAKARGFAVLPISSDRYFFGEHEFLSVFLMVHHFDERQQERFLARCARDSNYGVHGFSPTPVENPVEWIRSRATAGGSHAGFMEPASEARQKSLTFDFDNEGIRSKFQNYLATMTH